MWREGSQPGLCLSSCQRALSWSASLCFFADFYVSRGASTYKLGSNLSIAKTPAQQNGYDCGMYVLSISEAFVDVLKSTKSFDVSAFEERLAAKITPASVTKKRGELLKLIEKLAGDREKTKQ